VPAVPWSGWLGEGWKLRRRRGGGAGTNPSCTGLQPRAAAAVRSAAIAEWLGVPELEPPRLKALVSSSSASETPPRPNADETERQFVLRQADQVRADFAAILDELSFVQQQLARLPTRAFVSRLALQATFGVLAAITAAALLLLR